ncbi:MAG: primosomal protein N' [Xanthomonadaceae bacterium]|nr:primosomal protein N' [Xanthomonadaceae bacterium]
MSVITPTSGSPMNSPVWVVEVALPRPIDQFFTYEIQEDQAELALPGCWVKVPFGRMSAVGVIVRAPKKIDDVKSLGFTQVLKKVIKVGEVSDQIPSLVFKLCQWASDYYQSPLGELLSMAAPLSALSSGVNVRTQLPQPEISNSRSGLVLNDEQRSVLSAITAEPEKAFLIDGVTGSGKTEIYIERAKKVLAQEKGVIILVPEIALTPQLESRVREGLGVPIAVLHSALSDGQRRDYWLKLKSGELRVVVGARSALFAPMKSCGLIVVDEEHDASYKQEERARYQARDLAFVRAKKEKAQILFGSATPSLETLERVREEKIGYLKLEKRIINRSMPKVELVNLTDEPLIAGIQAPFSERTIEKIKLTLQKGEKVLIYLNRRGFASYLVCLDCGEVSECPRCSLSLTYHKRKKKLVCHTCDFHSEIPDHCKGCKGVDLHPIGAGTESLEDELPALIPEMKALRLDRDQVTSQTRLKKILSDFSSDQYNTLMGTQMVVKGHDFSEVTLVVVVLADGLFRWPDFRSNERAYQTLTQVAGRAGRGEKPGEVWIQTFDIDHPVLSVILGRISREDFYKSEQELRSLLHYPPYGRLLRLRLTHDTESVVKKEADQIVQMITIDPEKTDIEILGPSTPMIERVRGEHRMDILIKSSQIQWIHRAVKVAKKMTSNFKSTLLVDVDPYGVS